MTGIPLTVIGGYLGAGKTTLINQILRDPQGKRYLIMVNDFGAINVDAALLVSADEDTIQLSMAVCVARWARTSSLRLGMYWMGTCAPTTL